MALLQVTVASTDRYLTTTQAVKDVLGITTTSDDSRISSTILAASRWAESYVGYPLTLQKYREMVPGMGTRSLILARTPIRDVWALWDAVTTDDAEQVASSEFQVDHGAGLIRRPQGWEWSVATEPWLVTRPLPGQEFPAWMADYTAGYTLGLSTDSSLYTTAEGSTDTARTLPEDIEQAVVLKAAGMFSGDEDVTEEEVGDLRVSYASGSGQGGLRNASPADMLLAPYRRLA